MNNSHSGTSYESLVNAAYKASDCSSDYFELPGSFIALILHDLLGDLPSDELQELLAINDCSSVRDLQQKFIPRANE